MARGRPLADDPRSFAGGPRSSSDGLWSSSDGPCSQKRVVYGWPVVVCGRSSTDGRSFPSKSSQDGLEPSMEGHGRLWRESPIGSREAAMYHFSSRWQRGPPLPGRLRMTHWSSADGPTGARSSGELWELTGTTALKAWSHFPDRCK